MSPVEKILALDIGTRRVGVAISDEAGMFAFPVATYARLAGKAEAAVIDLVKSLKVKTLIAGLPLDECGGKTKQCEDVENFCRRLKKRLPSLDVVFCDEYASSREAEQRLTERGKSKRSPATKKGVIDAAAATIILQSFLDSR
jgi:putative holliday junction resolvase